jgi:hypothetical protein
MNPTLKSSMISIQPFNSSDLLSDPLVLQGQMLENFIYQVKEINIQWKRRSLIRTPWMNATKRLGSSVDTPVAIQMTT